ncbi:MAG TPA: hypothetical protein VHE35_29060 [Kofleriaceae bacterium]|nr:hypothetical protein [Kofleriaceae bacterium]
MGDAYTPGLTVTRSTTVRKTRRLPLPGSVLVEAGARVAATDVVARAALPGRVHIVNLATQLGVLPDELAPTLRRKAGDAVAKGDVVAETASFFGLFRSRVTSPTDGTLESVSDVTGQAVFREPPVPVEVKAYVDGRIVEVLAGEGVVVETTAALVQGIFGLAGEVHAPIVVVAQAPDQVLDAVDVGAAHRGKVVVGGARITLAGMRRAMELGVAAVVCGGIAYQDVRELLGYDVGVAVTGNEALATTLVVTEGFGDIAMATATFELLRSLDGRTASVCGATQIRAGVIRPEVVVPDAGQGAAAEHGGGLELGAPVRCIRAPYFGRIGTVAALPVELVDMPSETRVRVLEVDLGGERIVVPRANVEVIER